MVVFSQYVFHFTKLCPDMMNLNLDSGIINVNYFTFDFHKAIEKLNLNELVPFRLTPNIAEFVTDIGKLEKISIIIYEYKLNYYFLLKPE